VRSLLNPHPVPVGVGVRVKVIKVPALKVTIGEMKGYLIPLSLNGIMGLPSTDTHILKGTNPTEASVLVDTKNTKVFTTEGRFAHLKSPTDFEKLGSKGKKWRATLRVPKEMMHYTNSGNAVCVGDVFACFQALNENENEEDENEEAEDENEEAEDEDEEDEEDEDENDENEEDEDENEEAEDENEEEENEEKEKENEDFNPTSHVSICDQHYVIYIYPHLIHI
jgi:hypothetical protein